ncbi:RNase A-like domain-containing protein [Bacillus nakamurai]|uniref:RNase A-like domain-containing protein n=1 Tax=Bacillus nakamurai TaxID=1793963 RepID=UPI00398F38D6
MEAALNLVGAGALARHARKGIPLSTPPKIQKANNILEQVKQFKVPTNVRVYAEQPVTANGFPIGLPRVRADVKKTAVKDLGIVKMVGNGSRGGSFVKNKAYEADSIRRSLNNDILDIMENNGGHLLEKHVGKTNEQLLKRAAKEGVPSTTFINKSIALKATHENIRKNADQISKWLNHPDSRGFLITKTQHNFHIGKGVNVKNSGNSASKHVNHELSSSQLYLVKDQTMPNGYRIITGYPVF